MMVRFLFWWKYSVRMLNTSEFSKKLWNAGVCLSFFFWSGMRVPQKRVEQTSGSPLVMTVA